MNTFLKVVLVLLAAVVAIKLLPLTLLCFGLLCAAVATVAALGVSAVAIVLGIGLTLAVLLSPLWVPILAIVGIVALVRAGSRKTAEGSKRRRRRRRLRPLISGWRPADGDLCSPRMPPAELPSQIVTAISFIGRGGGAVKTLPGFKKSHHSVPDAANATTNAFLAKICEPELAADAERLFQDVRAALGYKRKDIALSVSGALAALTARDFTVEMLYALEEADPARYAVTTTLLSLRDAELARRAEFARVFAGRFSEISFALKKGARVEAVIDAIEALESEGDAPRLAVDYPSDCRECTISVPGVEAQVRCTGGTLDVIFPRGGAPAELIDAFAEIRAAFQISQVLAGLIG